MDRRVKHSIETRIEAGRLFDAGFGPKRVASQLHVSRTTVRAWRDRHQQSALLGLVSMGNKHYSAEVKIAAVELFLAGATATEVVLKFEISNRGVFNKWLANYRQHGVAVLQGKPRGRPAKKARVETLEEENARLRMEVAVLKKFNALMNVGNPKP